MPQYAAIKHRAHRLDRPANYAVHFLRTTIRQHPGEITLLSIGPLTNVATLFALDPELPWMLKGFVSMAGQFFEGNRREWNVSVDATASTMVYNRRWGYRTPHVNVGLDVTTKCQMPADEVRTRFRLKPLNVALEMAEVWFQHAKTITFHDPLAAALLFEPDLCTYAAGAITVPVEADKETAGVSEFAADPAGPHLVCQTVDSGRFFDHFFSVFG